MASCTPVACSRKKLFIYHGSLPATTLLQNFYTRSHIRGRARRPRAPRTPCAATQVERPLTSAETSPNQQRRLGKFKLKGGAGRGGLGSPQHWRRGPRPLPRALTRPDGGGRSRGRLRAGPPAQQQVGVPDRDPVPRGPSPKAAACGVSQRCCRRAPLLSNSAAYPF